MKFQIPDPSLFHHAQVMAEPVGFENGYWAGAPGVFHDPTDDAWYLTYRIRRPRGVHPERGGETRIARSTDLSQGFTDIWSVTKDKLDTASIERSALQRAADGSWRWFTSYVDPADGRWCTTVTKADSPDAFEVSQRQVIFTAGDLGLEGVKDPWITRRGETWWMLLSVALPVEKTSAESHGTLDIYNTGECLSATGLATSRDLDHWEWQGLILKPDGLGPWDGYCRRMNSFLDLGEQGILGFYDGSAGHHENYEERTGLAVSKDGKTWEGLTPEGPCLTSPHTTGSLRYIDAQIVGGKWHVFFEFARPDGAHDLRHLALEPGSFQVQP